MSETQAWLALMETAKRARWNGEQEARIAELAGDDETEPLPPVPPLRRPRLAAVDTAQALTRDEVRPGMRMIGGRWYYSAAWL